MAVEGAERVECGPRGGGVAEGDGPVEAGEATGDGRVHKHVVEQHDLLSVGGGPVLGFGVAGDDRGLKLVGAGSVMLGPHGE
jgi:hypothetical protein